MLWRLEVAAGQLEDCLTWPSFEGPSHTSHASLRKGQLVQAPEKQGKPRLVATVTLYLSHKGASGCKLSKVLAAL